MLKRLMSFLLALTMVLGMLPMTHAHATEAEEPAVEETVAEETMPEETVPEETDEATEETEETAEPVTEETTEATEETSAPTEEFSEAAEESLEAEVLETVDVESDEVESVQPALTASSNSGTCGRKLIWNLSDDGVLTISGSGAMTNYTFTEGAPWHGNCEAIRSVVIPYGVTSIGDYAFYGCINLSEIDIPDSVTRIGASAFSGCSSLTNINIPEGVSKIGSSAFNGCSKLKEIAIPGSAVSISMSAFKNCSSLTNVVLCEGITSIGSQAFSYCTSLTTIALPKSLSYVNGMAFFDCKKIADAYVEGFDAWMSIQTVFPTYIIKNVHIMGQDGKEVTEVTWDSSITKIPDKMFNKCTSLTSVTIPEGVTEIGEEAFAYCSGLKSLVIPKSVKTIGKLAFSFCDGLQTMVIPENATNLGDGILRDCKNLTSVQLPTGLTGISNNMFASCENLTAVDIPKNVTRIGSYAFSGCKQIQNFILPDKLTTIDQNAFDGCNGIKTIQIPNTVTYIGDGAFMNCRGLEWVAIPDGVSAIKANTFYGCLNLLAVYIPQSVTTIEEAAFYVCNYLWHIYYGGSEKQWAKISVEDQITDIQSVTRHYNANNASFVEYKNHDCRENYLYQCLICKKRYGSENPDAQHNYEGVEWSPVQEPTCKDFGYYTRKCNNCDFVDEKYVDALGHDYGEWVVTKEATTKKEGSKYRVCNRCQYKQTKTIGKLGSVGSGSCGKNVKWYLAKDGTLTIDGTGAMKDYYWDNPTAPWDEYNNKIKSIEIRDGVTSIGDFAFMGCYCTSVIIPSSVKTIGTYAFRNSSLQSVVIPDSVTKIEDRAFAGAESLKTVEIGNGITSIGDYAFYECEKLESVIIQGKLKTLKEHTFDGCTSLKYVELPDTIKTIEKAAFSLCQSLETIELPKNLTTIGAYAFENTDSLKNIVFPAKLKTIGKWAFGFSNLNAIIIPEGVTEIGDYAFVCRWAKTVSLPKTVTKIGKNTFKDCLDLESFVFCGTAEQWKKLTNPLPATRSDVKVQYHSFVDERCIYCKRKNGPCLVEHVGKEELRNVKVPTCTEKGYSGDVYCTTCGDLVKEGKESPVTHAYVDTVKSPTYTKKGYTEHTCSVCGHSYKDNYTDPLGLPKPSVKISVNNTTGKPVITWKAIDEVKQYWVYRATSKDGDYDRVAKTEQAGFEDTTAVAGKKYYYKVRAIGIDDSKSAYSSIVNVTCKCIAPVVSASVTVSSGNVKLSWESVKSAKTYYIYRAKTADGNYEKIASTTKTYYTDSSAAVGTTYHYKVKAIATSSAANSIYSNRVQAMCICAQPDLAVKVASSGKPSLTWIKVSGAKVYKILRAETQNGEYQLLTTTTSTSYTDKTAEFDKDYWYQIDVVGSKTGTDNDTDAAVKVHTTCAKPSVSITISSKKPQVSWKPVEGATKYYVYRATSKSGKYTKVATVTDATSYRDSKAKKGKTYYYKVKAVAANSAANSAYSSVKSIKSK